MLPGARVTLVGYGRAKRKEPSHEDSSVVRTCPLYINMAGGSLDRQCRRGFFRRFWFQLTSGAVGGRLCRQAVMSRLRR